MHLEDNNIVTHYQYGFVTKKSCFTNLMKIGLMQFTPVTVLISFTLTAEKHSIQCLIVDILENYLAMDLMESS